MKYHEVESKIITHLSEYYGKSTSEIGQKFGVNLSPHCKSRCSIISTYMLGGNGKRITEFDTLGINVKTIRLNQGGKPKDSMSFPALDYCEVSRNDWDDSEVKRIFSRRFLFLFFDNIQTGEDIFKKAIFWSLEDSTLDSIKEVWLDTKTKILNGDYSNFCKIRDGKVVHIRPHAASAADMALGPDGQKHEKKCFFLGREYIYSIFISNLNGSTNA